MSGRKLLDPTTYVKVREMQDNLEAAAFIRISRYDKALTYEKFENARKMKRLVSTKKRVPENTVLYTRPIRFRKIGRKSQACATLEPDGPISGLSSRR